MKVPFKFKVLWVLLSGPFRKKYTANICRHETKLVGFLIGERIVETITAQNCLTENGHPDYCLECLGKMTIPCAWCGNPIVVGKPVMLQTLKKDARIEISPGAVSYFLKDTLIYVGCVECYQNDDGTYNDGYWVPGSDGEGVVKLKLSIYQQMDNFEKDLWSNPARTFDEGSRTEPKLFPLK